MHRQSRMSLGRGFRASRAPCRTEDPREDAPSGCRDLNVLADEETLTTLGAIAQIATGNSRDGALVVVTQS
jgi:hypothetical protein